LDPEGSMLPNAMAEPDGTERLVMIFGAPDPGMRIWIVRPVPEAVSIANDPSSAETAVPMTCPAASRTVMSAAGMRLPRESTTAPDNRVVLVDRTIGLRAVEGAVTLMPVWTTARYPACSATRS